MAKDYYQLLGVERGASEKDIRAAYRRLARRFHPDVNPGDAEAEAKFKEVNEAYQTLSDPDSRAKYNRYGADWRKVSAQPDGPSEQPGRRTHTRFGGGRGGFNIRDLFDGWPPRAPQSLEGAVAITLEEAYAGCTRVVTLSPNGAASAPRRVEVDIPAGVATGSRVHVADRTNDAFDLYISVEVAPHPVFERRGDDLAAPVGVPLTDAVLGGEVEAPTIKGGKVALTIPAETQNGRTFRLKGQGMPRRGGRGYGDLLATVKVALPTGLSAEERALFEHLRQSRAADAGRQR